jgi:hypothetical protein
MMRTASDEVTQGYYIVIVIIVAASCYSRWNVLLKGWNKKSYLWPTQSF